jgi:formylglycine-generating enzyme required for sulfatase activity
MSLWVHPALAQPSKTASKPLKTGVSRWALLIGVEKYAELERLRFCGADIRALREALIAAGFPDRQVFLLHDQAADPQYRPYKSCIERQLEVVLKLAEPNDIVVVAFSGHGVHLDGKSYICPVDSRLREPQSLIPLNTLYQQLEQSAAALKLLLVDACRDDPRRGADRSSSVSLDARQFATTVEKPPRGIYYLASCAPGETSKEEPELGHGVFMHYVLQGLRGEADLDKSGRVSLLELCKYATTETKLHVARKYSDSQRPSYRVDATDDFDLTQASVLPKEVSNSIGMKLVLIPAGEFLMGSSKEEVDGLVRRHRSDPPDWYTAELPQHRVRITKRFYLGMHEVTMGQFQQFVGATAFRTDAERDGEGGWGFDAKKGNVQRSTYNWRNAGFAQTEDHPVMNVSWNDAVAFCDWIGKKEGKVYRLPTEAEWEYACRAGTTTRYYSGNDPENLATVGNVADGTLTKALKFSGEAIKARDGYTFTAPVGRFQANAFGLFDMHGNVAEWCQDGYDHSYYADSPVDDPQGPSEASDRVFRGGSWDVDARSCRSALRGGNTPAVRLGNLGFRVALSPSGQ